MRRSPRKQDGRPGRREHPVSAEEADPGRFRWLVDGHNAIFSVRAWEDLQVRGLRREARRALEESLEAFGRAAGTQVWVVYDGNHLERNPDAIETPHLRSEYSFPPEEADDRIRFLVRRFLQEGTPPVVVTSDRRTLAGTLPPGARSIEVALFFRLRDRLLRPPEKQPSGEGFDDLDRIFLSRSPLEEDRRLAAGFGDEAARADESESRADGREPPAAREEGVRPEEDDGN